MPVQDANELVIAEMDNDLLEIENLSLIEEVESLEQQVAGLEQDVEQNQKELEQAQQALSIKKMLEDYIKTDQIILEKVRVIYG